MFNKQMLKDFISYGIIASVFLIIPYSDFTFLSIIIPLIYDLIFLYIEERRENENVNSQQTLYK